MLAEIDEAAESDPTLDLWVLAASRSVNEQIATALDRHAEQYGVEVVLLDSGLGDLPRIAVLLASFPDTVAEWANRNAVQYEAGALRSSLETVANAADFAETKERLFRKLKSTAGYDAARRLVHEHLLTTLIDERSAHSAFRQSLGIRVPTAPLVRRTRLKKKLDEWWCGGDSPEPAVMLGEEGTGKTWAAFGWVLERIELGDMPIVLSFAAVAEDFSKSEPADSLLARLLTKWTGLLDETRWKRRLARWLNAETPARPLIFLLVDGINERAGMEWRSFFGVLLSAPWRDRVAVLVTDRPYHWRSKCSSAGLVTFRELPVGGYSHEELDEALAVKGISHRQIPFELLDLISKPRYCRLVANHYDEIIAAADFTRERLIYLEVKDRRSAKLGYPLTDNDLFEIIRALAERARANSSLHPEGLRPLISIPEHSYGGPILDPKQVRSLVSVPGGDEANIYEEIITGGILVPLPGNEMIVRFRAEPLRLIYGFGMLLAEELSSLAKAASSEIEDFLASWFEPQPDMDRKVEICGSAMFHALFQDQFPEAPFRELIRYWLGLRNWADTAQSAFANYVLRRPESFVGVADEFWSSGRDSGAAQEFLRAAFCAHRDDPNLQPVLVRAVERWMGYVHPLGRRFGQYDPSRKEQLRKTLGARGQEAVLAVDDGAEEERVRHGIESRAGRPVAPGDIEVAGVKLTVVSDGHLLRLARFGLMIVSAGPRLPFIHSFVALAVASAVMDDADFHDLASWVVHLSDDNVEPALLANSQALLARREATASEAARLLILTIGTSESRSLIERFDLTPEWYKERREEHARDPCKSFYEWTEGEGIACLGRDDIPLHIILSRAAGPIVDPSVKVPMSLIRRSQGALGAINPSAIHSGSSRTAQSQHLETLSNILCAYAPSELAAFMRKVVKTLSDRKLEDQYYLAFNLPEVSLLFGSDEVATVSSAGLALSAGASEWSDTDQFGPKRLGKVAEARAFSAVAPHLTPSELVRRLFARAIHGLDLTNLELWFAPVTEAEQSQVVSLLHDPPDPSTLRRVLWVLPYLRVSLTDSDGTRLVELAESEDWTIRAGAVRTAVSIDDPSTGRRIVDIGKFVDKDTHPYEGEWLTRLIGKYGSHLTLDDLAKRLRPSAMGFVIGERGYRPEEIALFGECLNAEWQQIISAEDPASGNLPEIVVSDRRPGKLGLPEFREAPQSRTVRLDRSNSWTSGPPTNHSAEIKALFLADQDEEIRKLNEDRRRKIDAILAAWKTEAFQWFGRYFNAEVLEKLYERSPKLVESWVEPALRDSLTGQAARRRLGSFLDPICRVFFDRNPPLGLKLWQMLCNAENNPVAFDTVDIAFGAGDSPESDMARRSILDGCWNDAAVSRVARSCVSSRRQGWLNKMIDELISAPQYWRKMKGLTLASFGEISVKDFELLSSKAAVVGSWVEDGLAALRENVRRNCLARHWFSIYLTASDPDVAWGALQIVVRLADERFLYWSDDIAKSLDGSESVTRRLRFLHLRWSGRDMRREFSREGDRTERFLGIRFQRGEIFPFI